MKTLTLLLILSGISTATAQVINPANGHTYMLTSGAMSIFSARAEAASFGGYLTSITDPTEQAFVSGLLDQAGVSGAFIGLSDEAAEGRG